VLEAFVARVSIAPGGLGQFVYRMAPADRL
jgi:hypothetical protein